MIFAKCGYSKYKENDWINELISEHPYYLVNAIPDAYINIIKGESGKSPGFSTKKCVVCEIRFDGSGLNEAVLPEWFNRMPMKVSICRKCKPPYKEWYYKNKERLHLGTNSNNGYCAEYTMKRWYNEKRKKNSR